MNRIATRPARSGRSSWRFARHFLEMCAAMCIGGFILNGLVRGRTGAVGVSGPAPGGSRAGAAGAGRQLCAADGRLDALRGMAWRPTLECREQWLGWRSSWSAWTGSTLSEQPLSRGWVLGFCGPACVVMIIMMLFRLDLYTGRTDHQMGGPARPR